MTTCIDYLVEYCLKREWISQNQVPWFRYGLEKRLSTVIGAIPFILIAILLTDLLTTIGFLGSFYFLRKYTNGYHAKTFLGCLLVSLGTELLFLLGLYPHLTLISGIILSTTCLLIICFTAPYNHPNMHLTAKEISATKIIIKRRVAILGCLLFILGILQAATVVRGLTVGIALTAFLLCVAYITERRKHQ